MPRTSAYDYMKEVQSQNAANGVACRPDSVLMVTDGLPGEDCTKAACAAFPPGPDCGCSAVNNAYALSRDLGVKLYVVGFSNTTSASAYAANTITNIARAGGTSPLFAVRENELYEGITRAIYDVARGSYSTSPLTGGASANGMSRSLLDARADFPQWRGHLITYDVSGSQPQVLWDAATFFDPGAHPDHWKKRNVWTASGSTMVKIQVDETGAITNAAALHALGLGETESEAALAARFILGDPAMKNPAPLGAMINSSPIEVAVPGGPALTYVGASDGMLHAFYSRTQSVGGSTQLGGKEAFAFIPQDMLPMVRRLFAQGGQRPAPSQHLYGLANSPKVKRFCVSNCSGEGGGAQKTVIVMPEGFGGNDLFALDVTPTGNANGISSDPSSPPVQLLWNTDTTLSGNQKAQLDAALGKTISLPGFAFVKSPSMDDFRVIYGSGYSDLPNSQQGLSLVTSSAATGAVRSRVSLAGLGDKCGKPRVDPTEPTLLADVAIAR
ncbi:MAG TPA: PilC/PilY family type IV pilus protein, partial [Polyangia bacterium]